MNRQQLADKRSQALHSKIAEKLRVHPELWTILEENIQRWEQKMGGLPPALYEWSCILHTYSKEEILTLLESSSEEAIRLRSSSPFTGILSQVEREDIMNAFKQRN
jgi:hypothetical protein